MCIDVSCTDVYGQDTRAHYAQYDKSDGHGLTTRASSYRRDDGFTPYIFLLPLLLLLAFVRITTYTYIVYYCRVRQPPPPPSLCRRAGYISPTRKTGFCRPQQLCVRVCVCKIFYVIPRQCVPTHGIRRRGKTRGNGRHRLDVLLCGAHTS